MTGVQTCALPIWSSDDGPLHQIRPRITTSRAVLLISKWQNGSSKEVKSSNGSLPVPFCGFTGNVRSFFHFQLGASLWWCIYVAGAGKSILWFVGLKLVLELEGTHFRLAPRSSKMPWSYATPDWHTSHTSTSIFGTQTSTPVTAYSSLSSTSSLHGQSPVAKYSTAFMLHTTMAGTNPATTL